MGTVKLRLLQKIKKLFFYEIVFTGTVNLRLLQKNKKLSLNTIYIYIGLFKKYYSTNDYVLIVLNKQICFIILQCIYRAVFP